MENPEQRLKNLRKILQLSQRELAAEFKVTGAAIAQWESGKRPIPGPVLKLIEIYEETLQEDDGISQANHLRKISSSWASRILSLLKYNNTKGNLKTSEDSVREGLEKYLDQSLPSDSISQKVRLQILQQIINAIGMAKGLPLKSLQVLTYAHPGLSSEIRRMILDLKYISPAMPLSIVSKIIFEEFGRTPKEIFASFSTRPIATASIGQVHLATLHSGEKVAVKIQYPEIQKSLEADFNLLNFLGRVANLLKPIDRKILDEIHDAVISECNYLKEASHQEMFREFFKNDSDILIPKVHFQYCSERVLTTDFIEGQSLEEFLTTSTDDQRTDTAKSLAKFCITSIFRRSVMHADIQTDNFLFLNGKVAILDFGRIVYFDHDVMENHRNMFKAIINDDVELARQAVARYDFIRDHSALDFEEFWSVLKGQQAHLCSSEPFVFTKETILQSQKVANSYSGKNNLILSRDILWSTCTSYGLWMLFAELGASIHWGPFALDLLTREIG